MTTIVEFPIDYDEVSEYLEIYEEKLSNECDRCGSQDIRFDLSRIEPGEITESFPGCIAADYICNDCNRQHGFVLLEPPVRRWLPLIRRANYAPRIAFNLFSENEVWDVNIEPL